MKTSECLYQTIYNRLLNDIQNNHFADGNRLPTEQELAEKFYVSRITAKKALNTLAAEGIVVRIPGRGTFVKKTCAIPTVRSSLNTANKFIALVMGGYSSSFGLDIIYGAMHRAGDFGLNLVIKATESQENETEIINTLIADGIAGIIVQPSQGELYNEAIIKASFEGVPITMIDRNMSGINAPFVGANNSELSKFATNKLLENGHKNIALLALADEKSSTIKERMNGFTDAFVDKLTVMNKGFWLIGLNKKYRRLSGESCTGSEYEFFISEIAEHLRKFPEITAVFGTEYVASKAACDAVRKIGKRVPEDISIVSFDSDSSYIGLHSMSYIKQPQNLMGAKSVELLYDLIQHNPPKEQQLLLPGEWVDGASIRKLP